MRLVVLVLVSLLLAMSAYAAQPEAPLGELLPADYLRCTDGDTIIVIKDSVETRIRLTGVSAPEIDGGTAAGFASAAACAQRCEDAVSLWLEIDPEKPKDRYGRTLAWVWVSSSADGADPELLNTWLIDNGHALIYPSDEAKRYLQWKE